MSRRLTTLRAQTPAEPPATDEPARQPLTTAQIAELAGVSIPTVSRVVNGRSDVSSLTRARVETVIREHGYQRLRKAAHPAELLELVFHQLEGAYAMEIIRGVEQVAREHGLAVVLSELQGRHTPDEGWMASVLSRRPTGVIAVFSSLTSGQREQLQTRSIPFVVVDPTGEPGHQTPSIGTTNWSGGLSATRHLLDLGHRRIAVLTGPLRILCSRARRDGYRAAMDAAGVPVDPELICEGEFRVEDGLELTRRLLRLANPPTAIVAGNDLQALGVYQAAAEVGRRIPADLSVVGFDDLPLVRWISPPLTTVRQPLTSMGVAAATMVVTMARGEALPQERIELATGLVVRGSTASASTSGSRRAARAPAPARAAARS